MLFSKILLGYIILRKTKKNRQNQAFLYIIDWPGMLVIEKLKFFMNRQLIYLVLILFGSIGFITPLLSQVKDDQLKEVLVTNVEVPVRVFHKGKAVTYLKKEDFKLFEDGQLKIINGFFLKKKKLKVEDIELSTNQDESKQAIPPRFFVLVFRLIHYNEQLKKGVSHLFKNILRESDQILVFVNDKTLFLDNTYWKISRKDLLEQVLAEEGLKARQRLNAYFTKIQKELNRTRTEIKLERGSDNLPVTSRVDYLVKFLEHYLETWKEYKNKYLLPDLDSYYNFSHFLEKIRKEKWVINFYQIEMFPKMKETGELRQQIEQIISEMMVARSEDVVHSRILVSLLSQIDRELNVADDFPSDEISKLFYKVDVTFHSIFLGVRKETLSQDLEFRKISTDIENSLREITLKTGGQLVTSGNLESALHSISEKEDFYYLLTYAPEDPDKIGRIKIVLNPKKNYRVIYDSNIRANYIQEYLDKKRAQNPTVKINEISFKEKKLFLVISNFLRKKLSKREIGKLNVRVRIKNHNNEIIFDESRIILPKKELTTLTINFKWMKRGEYYVIVDIVDIFTGKTIMEFLQPEVI
jgi:hypothetical protein